MKEALLVATHQLFLGRLKDRVSYLELDDDRSSSIIDAVLLGVIVWFFIHGRTLPSSLLALVLILARLVVLLLYFGSNLQVVLLDDSAAIVRGTRYFQFLCAVDQSRVLEGSWGT